MSNSRSLLKPTIIRYPIIIKIYYILLKRYKIELEGSENHLMKFKLREIHTIIFTYSYSWLVSALN